MKLLCSRIFQAKIKISLHILAPYNCYFPQWCHTHMYAIGLLSLQEGNVEEGGVEVDKLEEIHLCDETVIIVTLCPVQL